MTGYSNPLQELVDTRLKELNISVREAAGRSFGHVSHTNIQRIRSGDHQGKLGEETIVGLAIALDVAPEEVRDAAYATVSPAAFQDYFGRLQTLSPSRQLEVLERMRELLERHEAEQKTSRKRKG